MKRLFLFAILLIIFNSCDVLEHSNPLDPKSPNYSAVGAFADFKIRSSQLDVSLSTPGSSFTSYTLKIALENTGKGQSKSPLYAVLSVKESGISFPSGFGAGATFKNTYGFQDLINKGDILEGIYILAVSNTKTKPFNSKFILSIKDGFNNQYLDSLTVSFDK